MSQRTVRTDQSQQTGMQTRRGFSPSLRLSLSLSPRFLPLFSCHVVELQSLKGPRRKRKKKHANTNEISICTWRWAQYGTFKRTDAEHLFSPLRSHPLMAASRTVCTINDLISMSALNQNLHLYSRLTLSVCVYPWTKSICERCSCYACWRWLDNNEINI